MSASSDDPAARASPAHEHLAHEHLESSTVIAAGVDEVSVVAWPTMFAHRVARKVGLTRSWATLIVVLAGLFTVSFTITLLVVSLGTIAKDLNSTSTTLSWAITGPMLAFGIVGPAYGKAGDLWGHKRVFVFGLLFSGIFAAFTALAWNAATLIAFRTLSASAGAATGPAAMAYINRLFEPSQRVRPLGYWSFATALAPVLGVVMGAPLVESVGWRVIFAVQAPLLLLGVLIAVKLLPETPRTSGVKFDIVGSLTLGLGAMFILLSVNRGSSWGWSDQKTLIGLMLGIISLIIFVKTERRVESPLMPLHWFKTRNLTFPVLSQLLTNFAYMGGFIVIPQLLENGIGLTASHIGWLIIARPLAFSLTAPVASLVTMRIGERLSGMIGAGVVVGAMIILSQIDIGSPDWLIMFGLGLTGMGLGIASPALTSLVANSVSDNDLGVVGALQQLMTQLGAVIGSTVMIAVHEATASSGVVQSYSYALLTGAVAAGLAVLAASAARSTPRAERLPGHENL